MRQILSQQGVQVVEHPLQRQPVPRRHLGQGLRRGGRAAHAALDVVRGEDPARTRVHRQRGVDGHLRAKSRFGHTIAAMKVRLLFFPVLRDIVGKSEADVEVPDATRALDLWQRLRSQYAPLAAYAQPPMTAVNESYVTPEAALRDGDEVAFIPPVAGG